MRIKSDFHDYYDLFQRYDEDRDTLYIRKTKTVEEDLYKYRSEYDSTFFSQKLDIKVKTFGISFCGNGYRCIKYILDFKSQGIVNKTETVIFYDENQIEEKLITKLDNKQLSERWFGKPLHWSKDYLNKKNVVYKNNNTLIRSDYNPHEEHIKYNTPIIYRGDNKVIINPNLSKLSFPKAVPPQQAYQELCMYFAGPLSGQIDKIPPISNNDLIEAKGFDLKTSFRKGKQDGRKK